MKDTFEERYRNLIEKQKALLMLLKGEGELYALQGGGSLYVEECFTELLKDKRVTENPHYKYLALSALSQVYWQFEDTDNLLMNCKLARSLKPEDLIANVELARAYEAKGMAKEAIVYYESALKDSSITSDIRDFILAEINRVRTEGPNSSPPFAGLRLLTG